MAGTRERIFKTWAGVSEVALIKEVATKGEHVQLCIEYWARKRKLPLAEYELFFHDVVQTYVQRLLSERLVFKAENVLANVQRDVRCVYYQFACESDDEELRELLLDYLRKKDSDGYAQAAPELQFHWELLQQLQACPNLLAKCKAQLRRVNVETLLHCDAAYLKRLLVELYFANRNAALLERISKFTVWQYLVEMEEVTHLARWCCLNGSTVDERYSELERQYCQWPLEPEMYEYALKSLKRPNEILRNCFASAGYFFADERDQVAVVVRRICTSESLACNREMLEKLAIGRFLLQRGLYFLMLCRFVNARELEEMAEENADEAELLRLIVALKEHDLQERDGFEKVCYATKLYLEQDGVDFQSEQTLVQFFEFLCNEPTVATLNCFLLSSTLQHIPYLKSLAYRLENSNSCINNLPTPYDFLRKFKQIDFRQLCKELAPGQVASFSNERMCAKYARKHKLNFLHYLKQQRSSYAVYYLLIDHLQQYGQLTRAHLFSACETVTELALQHATNDDLVSHCVAFIEMLGYDSQLLRNYLKLGRLVEGSVQEATDADVNAPANYAHLLVQVERVLVQRIEQQPVEAGFPLADYQALMRIVVCNRQRHWPELIMQRYAREDDWWRLLVLLQYFEVPLPQLQQLVAHFETRVMGEHLLRALLHEPAPQTKRHASFSNRQQKKTRKPESNSMTTSVETINSSIGSSCNDANNALFRTAPNQQQLQFLPDACGRLDLFAIVLLSNSSLPEECISSVAKFMELMQDQRSCATSNNLLRNCVKFRVPVLAVLAATVNTTNVNWHWLVWLAVATDQWHEVQRLAAVDPQEISWRLVENAVRQGDTNMLKRSFCIFFEDNAFVHLCGFLQSTQHQRHFGDEDVQTLRLYLLAWSNDAVRLPHCEGMQREELMLRSIRLLLVHLQCNFDSTVEQHKFIGCICRSDMSDICSLLDFCQLHAIFGILQPRHGWSQCFSINFERLLQRGNKEYAQLLTALREAGEYTMAVQLATLLQLPVGEIVYAKWVAELDSSESNAGLGAEATLQKYEAEIAQHSLPPELLVNFFRHAAGRLQQACTQKYQLLKRALNVIKQHHLFPNEFFDRDQIEYEMVICYLQLEEAVEQLPVYHSEYYEQIMLKERCVLYKSFQELKELAGIEDLNVSVKQPLSARMQARLEALLNQLLDKGDIVEALRLQELFECRPIDLRFVVFCMALAEGVTTIFSMSSEERQLLRDIEKSSFAKFNKRTLGTGFRTSGSYQDQSSSSKTGSDLSDSCSTLEFEEIPSKEKRETLDTIQGIASKLRYGVDIGRRIVMAYRAAMYLDKEYLDVLRTKDTTVLLQSVAEEGCLHRLLVVSDILTSTHMTAQEIAELLAFEIATAVVRPRFYIFSANRQAQNTFKNADLWGYNIDRDHHLFLELAPNTTKLGNCLLEYCDALKAYRKYQDNKPYVHNTVFERLAEIIRRYGLPTVATVPPIAVSGQAPPQVLSHKKQNLIYVELLIKAHQCYVHECSMEGIANVLNRAKALNAVLTQAKSWSLIVRMLSGIARYREMFYCFDTLLKNDQFESLLGQFEAEKTVGLRQGILTYLREYSPANSREYLKLAALHFLMYQELAEMWEQDARTVLAKALALSQVGNAHLPEQVSMANLTTASTAKTLIPKLRSSAELIELLQQVMENYTHATENYLLDNKLLLAQRSVSMAEMVAMQIDLATKTLDHNVTSRHCVCVIQVQSREEFRELINAELSVPQALILSRAYNYDINWSEVLLSQYVILKKAHYLQEYMAQLPISDNIIDTIVKGFQLYAQHHRVEPEMEQHLAHLVSLVRSVTLRYKLASLLSLKPIIMSLINDQSVYYLRDTNYGRSDNRNLSDI